ILDLEYSAGQYQYTLYYYDEAGNLVKTVPPQGVQPITSQAILNTVMSSRFNNGAPVVPEHTLATVYEYNSLNQVTRQLMPDHRTFDENGATAVTGNDKYYSTRFWYDPIGRLVASQNSRQAKMTPPRYSYTSFDPKGRVVEIYGPESSGKTT
ncbi:MAG: hypothetical protein V4616_09880, partial [Bacteroidota bacterium]